MARPRGSRFHAYINLCMGLRESSRQPRGSSDSGTTASTRTAAAAASRPSSTLRALRDPRRLIVAAAAVPRGTRCTLPVASFTTGACVQPALRAAGACTARYLRCDLHTLRCLLLCGAASHRAGCTYSPAFLVLGPAWSGDHRFARCPATACLARRPPPRDRACCRLLLAHIARVPTAPPHRLGVFAATRRAFPGTTA